MEFEPKTQPKGTGKTARDLLSMVEQSDLVDDPLTPPVLEASDLPSTKDIKLDLHLDDAVDY